MIKKEMIEAMSDETGATFKDTNETFDAFIKVITRALIQNDKVTILGFGTFSSKYRPQREGRNPSTGETITIAASNTPSFKSDKTFKDDLN